MTYEFHPPGRTGLIFQGGAALLSLLAGGYFFFRASQSPTGVGFIFNMLIALAIFSPLPFLIYRLYALNNAIYVLRRNGLMIRWGLRREEIPLVDIEWVRPATELGFRLPLPWFRWPGAILGTRNVSELGQVEFMSSDLSHMILVATREKVFAISPIEANQFMAAFQRVSELGSLTPLDAQSVYPKAFVGQIWKDRLARLLIFAGLGIGLLLLGAVLIIITGRDTIAWIEPGVPAPAERLLLLPILNGFVFLFNQVFGLFLFRRGGKLQIAAYMLWGNSALTGFILLVAGLLLAL